MDPPPRRRWVQFEHRLCAVELCKLLAKPLGVEALELFEDCGQFSLVATSITGVIKDVLLEPLRATFFLHVCLPSGQHLGSSQVAGSFMPELAGGERKTSTHSPSLYCSRMARLTSPSAKSLAALPCASDSMVRNVGVRLLLPSRAFLTIRYFLSR